VDSGGCRAAAKWGRREADPWSVGWPVCPVGLREPACSLLKVSVPLQNTRGNSPVASPCEVGEVDDPLMTPSCPVCRSDEVPILVVRGSGSDGLGLALQCRECQHEWAREPAIH
jgi:hypothetical protein